MVELDKLKKLSAQDRRMIEQAQLILGPEPSQLGLVKSMFWGNFRQDLVFPYPSASEQEDKLCNQMLSDLDEYLNNEHPAARIDQEQEIPRWVFDRLFELGVMGMTIPKDFGGLGMGVSSYNRVLERLGRTCGSTAVLVSAHQSIGCKAIMLFGTEEQKRQWLPRMATSQLAAFCLSEPNVGCDAGGQETECQLSEDGEYYLLNGEKKWATSAAISGLFTVMAKHVIRDDRTGKEQARVTALLCTPDMPGIEIFEKNRSKCGIRGTWQARIRFRDVKVPRENLLHEEGKGMTVALTCLNFGRCTLSAGMLGSARQCMDQSIKWSQTRYQFGRALSEFDLVRARIARMAALTVAMDAVLYMTTAMLDRHDEDVMIETALCKVFCSEMGWVVVNDAMQIMGGEGYMTENEIERAFRDSRINLIVEGANEVMQTFVFGYGGKQLAEQMLSIWQAFAWDTETGVWANLRRIVGNSLSPTVLRKAIPLGCELFLGLKKRPPRIDRLPSPIVKEGERLCDLIREHSHRFKMQIQRHREGLMKEQMVQARLSDSAMWLYAMTCVLSKLDDQVRRGDTGLEVERDREAALHFFEFADLRIRDSFRALRENADAGVQTASAAALRHNDTLPNSLFIVPEKSPVAEGTGRKVSQDGIKQFPGMQWASRNRRSVLDDSAEHQSHPEGHGPG